MCAFAKFTSLCLAPQWGEYGGVAKVESDQDRTSPIVTGMTGSAQLALDSCAIRRRGGHAARC